MKIEFEIALTDFEKSLVEHLEIESRSTIHEILKAASESYMRRKFSERREAIAVMLARGDKIEEAILAESLEVAKARAPIW